MRNLEATAYRFLIATRLEIRIYSSYDMNVWLLHADLVTHIKTAYAILCSFVATIICI